MPERRWFLRPGPKGSQPSEHRLLSESDADLQADSAGPPGAVKRAKRVAVLSPVAWRTPPRHYGAWETVASNLTEGLVARGWDVTLFATGDSITRARLHAVIDKGYEEDPAADPKVAEYLHIAEAFEHAAEFDLIHSHYDFMALSYSRLVQTPVLTTIHGFSSPKIMPVYEKYRDGYYVSISDADRAPALNYLATVYNGIDLSLYRFQERAGEDLIFLGRIHPDKGVHLAIEVARRSGRRLIIAGIVQDEAYFHERIEPHVDGGPPTMSGPWACRAKTSCSLRPARSCTSTPSRSGSDWSGRGQRPGRARDRDGSRLLPRGDRGRQDRLPGQHPRAGGSGIGATSPRSTAAPAYVASSSAFRSPPWSRPMSRSMRPFSSWRRASDDGVPAPADRQDPVAVPSELR